VSSLAGDVISSQKLSSSIESKEQELSAALLKRSLSQETLEMAHKTERAVSPVRKQIAEQSYSINKESFDPVVGNREFSKSCVDLEQGIESSIETPAQDDESFLYTHFFSRPSKPSNAIPRHENSVPQVPLRKHAPSSSVLEACPQTAPVRPRRQRNMQLQKSGVSKPSSAPASLERVARETWKENFTPSSRSSTPAHSLENTPKRTLLSASSTPSKSTPVPQTPTSQASEYTDEIFTGMGLVVGAAAFSTAAPVVGALGIGATLTGYAASKGVQYSEKEQKKIEKDRERTNNELQYLAHKLVLEKPSSPQSLAKTHKRVELLVRREGELQKKYRFHRTAANVCKAARVVSVVASLGTAGSGVHQAAELLQAGPDILSMGITASSVAADQLGESQDKESLVS